MDQESGKASSEEWDAADADGNGKSDEIHSENKKRNRAGGGGKRGVCYLSRVPPNMNPSHVRRLLSEFGEIDRIYLVPEDHSTQGQSKKSGSSRVRVFSEGWVEFMKKSVAKRVANLLNGEQIGGRKRSPFYYDIWNIKYLRKFKWDDLVNETAIQTRIRESKLAMEISAANREREFFLSKYEKSHVLKQIRERKQKKQKLEGMKPAEIDKSDATHYIPQKPPVDVIRADSKPQISEDILAGVFSGTA